MFFASSTTMILELIAAATASIHHRGVSRLSYMCERNVNATLPHLWGAYVPPAQDHHVLVVLVGTSPVEKHLPLRGSVVQEPLGRYVRLAPIRIDDAPVAFRPEHRQETEAGPQHRSQNGTHVHDRAKPLACVVGDAAEGMGGQYQQAPGRQKPMHLGKPPGGRLRTEVRPDRDRENTLGCRSIASERRALRTQHAAEV